MEKFALKTITFIKHEVLTIGGDLTAVGLIFASGVLSTHSKSLGIILFLGGCFVLGAMRQREHLAGKIDGILSLTHFDKNTDGTITVTRGTTPKEPHNE